MISITKLKVGDIAKIIGFNQMDRAYRQRLVAMGFTRGTKFQVVRIAPLGDPIQINIRGFALSLRKHEASGLIIEKVMAEPPYAGVVRTVSDEPRSNEKLPKKAQHTWEYVSIFEAIFRLRLAVSGRSPRG